MTTAWHASLIRPKPRCGISVTQSSARRSNGFGMRIIRSTGVRKAWHELKREGFDRARCPGERLMKQIGIRGAVRGKVVQTMVPDTSAP
jgi:hypothetical protein